MSRLTAIAILMMLAMTCHSQSRYRFYTLGTEQGLTSDYAWSVCQDKYNYIWIGTSNGLNRFDGHQIRHYLHNPKDSFSIPGNSVYWIQKDNDGELWFSLGWQGIARYNYALDRFEKFTLFDSIRKANNYGAPAWRMGKDLQGRLYFACGGAVFRYEKKTNKMEDLTPLFKGAITGYGVGMFVPQGNNIIWILTGNGLFKYDLRKNDVRQINYDRDKYGFGERVMHDAEFINDHEMIISVTRAGFVLFDTRDETFRLPPPPFNPAQSGLYSETGGVHKDSQGRIWIANSRFGLLEYFPATNSTYSMKNETSYPFPYKEQEGYGTNVYEDNDGNIWYCSTNKGVVWFRPSTDFIQVYQRDYSKDRTLPDNMVNHFLPVGDETMYIATNRGIVSLNRKTNQFTNYPISFDSAGRAPHPFVRVLFQSANQLVMSTYKGLSFLNLSDGKFSRYQPVNQKVDSVFPYGQWLIHQTSPSELLVSAMQWIKFNLATKSYRYPGDSPGLKLDSLSDINASYYDEKKKELWTEAFIGRLYRYDMVNDRLEQHFYDTVLAGMIDVIKMDSTGNIWIGCDNGLYVYDPAKRVGKKVELNTLSAPIYNIQIQNRNTIWLTTPTEVLKYNPQTGVSDILAVRLILPNSHIGKRAFLLDEQGFLWVGTNRGFFKIQASKFDTRLIVHEPQLVKFAVRGNELPLMGTIEDNEPIRLKHTENFFSIGISSFNYLPQGATTYSYRLEGFDREWQTSSSNAATYTNVPPGTYRLFLRTSNPAGGWIQRKEPIMIIIRPPLWQTWWFYVLMAAAMAAVAIFIVRWRKRRKQKRKLELAIDYFANSLVHGEASLHDICADISLNCIAQLGLQDCAVYLYDEKRNLLVQHAAFTANRQQSSQHPHEILWGEGLVGKAAAGAKKEQDRRNGHVNGSQLLDSKSSRLAMPVIHEGRAIGVIEAAHRKRNFFTPANIKAISTIAAISANKIAETRSANRAREREIQLLEIRKLLAESQLMALRAQMNPHFVFNCLNSIQECIVTEKYAEASLYLNKFSKLFRSLLNNSGKVLISVAEEIEILELYLSLEQMRFENSFEYEIDIEDGFEEEEINIPSMLLQPYVENALWHGLMHKEGERRLVISFARVDEEVYQCIIDDNGIGRRRAMELRDQQLQTKKHESKGMSIAQDRLDLLQKQGQHAQLSIIDKYDDLGRAEGTRIVVELSTDLKA